MQQWAPLRLDRFAKDWCPAPKTGDSKWSVCGTDNPVAFAKLQRLLVMYFAMRQKVGGRLGEVQATEIERYVVNRLRSAFPDLGSSWPP